MSMYKIKIIVLYCAKYLGLFKIAKIVTSRGLRIICYHGFSLDDEHLFRPKLFMTRDLFARRLAKISKMGFSVISLDKAVQMITAKEHFSNSLVFTVDDGWQGVEDIAWPLLSQYHYDWTLYLTSYYAEKQTQVMNVAIQYLCWKTTKNEVTFPSLGKQFEKGRSLHTLSDRDILAKNLSDFGVNLETAEDRQNFLRQIALSLDVDSSVMENKRLFYLTNMESIQKMHESGVDIQLHTHRHTLGGVNKNNLNLEIRENKDSIHRVLNHRLQHFCYPSGYYEKEHLAWLAENDVISATTCKPGLNYSTTPLLELRRFLDGENITDIEFEAELSGFSDFLRYLKSLLNVTRHFH
ncbi:hypothetical protein BH11PSE12_BH11PSE12_21770 [soil metagenome]